MERIEFDRTLRHNPEKVSCGVRDFVRSPRFAVLLCGILMTANGILDSIEEERKKDQVSPQKEQLVFPFSLERNPKNK